jgi:hypothetical protein
VQVVILHSIVRDLAGIHLRQGVEKPDSRRKVKATIGEKRQHLEKKEHLTPNGNPPVAMRSKVPTSC